MNNAQDKTPNTVGYHGTCFCRKDSITKKGLFSGKKGHGVGEGVYFFINDENHVYPHALDWACSYALKNSQKNPNNTDNPHSKGCMKKGVVLQIEISYNENQVCDLNRSEIKKAFQILLQQYEESVKNYEGNDLTEEELADSPEKFITKFCDAHNLSIIICNIPIHYCVDNDRIGNNPSFQKAFKIFAQPLVLCVRETPHKDTHLVKNTLFFHEPFEINN